MFRLQAYNMRSLSSNFVLSANTWRTGKRNVWEIDWQLDKHQCKKNKTHLGVTML